MVNPMIDPYKKKPQKNSSSEKNQINQLDQLLETNVLEILQNKLMLNCKGVTAEVGDDVLVCAGGVLSAYHREKKSGRSIGWPKNN